VFSKEPSPFIKDSNVIATNSTTSFAQALAYFQDGHFPQAEQLLRQLVARDRANAPALHLLGVLAYQNGYAAFALNLFQRATALDETNAEYQICLGAAHQALGQQTQAAICHRRALELRPGDPQALNNLGVALMAQEQVEEATAAFRQALAGTPDDPAALSNLAAALAGQKEYAEAIALYRRALARCPGLPQTHNNLGNALKAQGKYEEAEACYRRALQLWPRFAQAHYNLGALWHARGRPRDAVEAYGQALAITPNDVQVQKDLARALLEVNRSADAVGVSQQVLQLRPDDAEAWNDLGNACYARSELEDAQAHYRKAIALAPDWSMPRYNLGLALQSAGRLTEGRARFQEALALKPEDAVAHSTYVGSLYYDPAITEEQILTEHRAWDERHVRLEWKDSAHKNDPNPKRRLRIGYVSPDFRSHAVAAFVEPILAHHDRAGVETFCYAEVTAPDATTAKLRRLAHHWRQTAGLSDAELAALIRADGIDILVDLAGHTGHNRLLTLARKPAPIQVSYLGYPGTTGLAAIDYQLVDAITDPPDEPIHSSEKLVLLPGAFCCYTPPAVAPPVTAELPAHRNGFVTFGSLHKLEKLNDAVVDLWSAILRDVRDSRLLLARDTLHGATAAYWTEQFGQRGIEPQRLLVRRVHAVGMEHLAAYHDIDIALDVFPWNGHTSACEALWMGVPVLTLCGSRHASRMVASVLTCLELTGLIAETVNDYRSFAVSLAHEEARRAEHRANLRQRLLDSPLCDGDSFTRSLEEVYRQLWRRWCKPASAAAGAMISD
jgi:predicted O-linked N-acetylglucosamine transferase (SPINDLY family)